MNNNSLAVLESTQITRADVENVMRTPVSRNTLAPSTFGEMMGFAQMLSKSTFVPKDFVGKPENILVAIQWGMEIGLAPLQALQNIAVINGRPSLWGDAALAVVQNHPAYEWHKEYITGDGENMIGFFEIKRRGSAVHEAKFSVADAKKANLWGKAGPWTQYPKRMLCLRARGFGLRDKFADALKGLITAEEAQDYPTNPPLMTTNYKGEMEPLEEVIKKPVVSATEAPKETNPFHYGAGTLRCTPLSVERKISKKNSAFLAIKVNGKVNGKDKIFCFHESMFDALMGAVNQDCNFTMNNDDTPWMDIAEIISIGESDYLSQKDQLTKQLEESLKETQDRTPF